MLVPFEGWRAIATRYDKTGTSYAVEDRSIAATLD